jgi:hypothetical protein
MTARGSKQAASDKGPINRIWIRRIPEGGEQAGGDGPEGPETTALLDRVVTWTLAYLQSHGVAVQPGRDGHVRTLDFATEADCLEAHERLVAANEAQRDFRFRFVLRPSGVTVLVVS